MDRQTTDSHFDQIVGLRGYLALWVALGHAIQLAGIQGGLPIRLLADNGSAVLVFMIVSGFVITHLLLAKRESYPQYITRRFFRLYPAFVVSCVIGFATWTIWPDVVQNVSWALEPWWAPYVASVIEIRDQTFNNTMPHLLLHAGMLHGAVPDSLLPRASATFLPAAWSISLEWQFYLLAPAILWSIWSPRRMWVAALATLALVALTSRGVFGTFEYQSFIGQTIGYFLLGGASRAMLPILRSATNLQVSAIILVAAGLPSVVSFSTGLYVWLIFYFLLLWADRIPRVGKAFSYATSSPWPFFLGTISYSLYLLHRPFQVGLTYLGQQIGLDGRLEVLAMQLVGTALCVPASWLMYRYVELPGIDIGRWLARQLNRRAARPVVPAADR